MTDCLVVDGSAPFQPIQASHTLNTTLAPTFLLL